MASPRASHLLYSHKTAKIHSIFSNGFHFIVDNQLVYVSYYPSRYLGAFDLRIEKSFLEKLLPQIQIGQLIKLSPDQLTFYTRPRPITFQLQLKSAPDLKLKSISLDLLSESSQLILTEFQKQAIFGRSGFADNKAINSVYSDIIQSGEINAAQIKQFIGAGKGLTPSGDDFLQGYLMMNLVTGLTDESFNHYLTEMLEKRQTTIVAFNYYQALMAGYLNEFWFDFFAAWTEKNPRKIKDIIHLISRYGHSSGCDLLLGVQAFIEHHMKND